MTSLLSGLSDEDYKEYIGMVIKGDVIPLLGETYLDAYKRKKMEVMSE